MTASPNPDEKKKDGKAQQKLKFYGVVAALTLLCAGFIWFIFKPDPKAQPVGATGLNTEMPDATVQTTVDDKQKAFEQEQLAERQRERTLSLQDFRDLPLAAVKGKSDSTGTAAPVQSTKPAADPIRQSQATYQQINRQLTGFYQNTGEDPQMAELRRQIVELSAKMEAQGANPNNDPFAIMEKSYELASKHFPQQTQAVKSIGPDDPSGPVSAARRADDDVTSALNETVDLTPQERNFGFVTAVGVQAAAPSNAIRACVNDDQVITAGSRVCLRLLEPLKVSGLMLPVNAPMYGNARIEGSRLNITVSSIEYEGNVIPVNLVVHDTDGQKGLYIPNTMERTAMKEAAASIGSGFGSSISMSQSAGQQVAMDLTRGLMTGGSQYIAQKVREVKINLKANYQILLISKE